MSPDARSSAGRGAGSCGCSEPADQESDTCYCSVDHLVDVISRKHALSILNFVGNRGTARFSEVEKGLGGVSSSTLSDTLQQLAAVDLLERRVIPEAPPRVEYSLTEAGGILRRRFRTLLDRVRGTGASGQDGSISEGGEGGAEA